MRYFDVSKDFSLAKKWLELAANEDGNSSILAKHVLAGMYSNGQGVPQDHKIALKLYQSAAELGFAPSQAVLGVLCASGIVIEQNSVSAYIWTNVAELNGISDAADFKKLVAKQMTPADISSAQKLARECVRKKYKGC